MQRLTGFPLFISCSSLRGEMTARRQHLLLSRKLFARTATTADAHAWCKAISQSREPPYGGRRRCPPTDDTHLAPKLTFQLDHSMGPVTIGRHSHIYPFALGGCIEN